MMQLVLITGMSGAGKSRAAAAMEDLGYYCVDNLPPQMANALATQCGGEYGMDKVAVVVDARCGKLLEDVTTMLEQFTKMRREGTLHFSLLFLDCERQTLLNRYKETRRRHPLISSDVPQLEQALALEETYMQPLRARADYLIDTTKLSVSQLRQSVTDIFFREQAQGMLVNCMSFGFKYGAPTEADLVFDVRCLPNPFYIDALRSKTGLDQDVRDYVLHNPDGGSLLRKLEDLLLFLLPLYQKEGKTQLTVAFGCTGGKHRSVTFAHVLHETLSNGGFRAVEFHRDFQKK